MPRPRVHGLESYKDIPLDHPLRRKIQNRNAQRTFRKKRAASNNQEGDQATKEQVESSNCSATATSGSAESGGEAEGSSNNDTINVEPWVLPAVSSPQDLNINSLELESHDAVGSDALEKMENTNGMSHGDSLSFSRPASHPQLDTGFLDPADLYPSNNITNQDAFPPPFSVNGADAQFEFDTEWQPVQHQIPVQTSGASAKQSRRRSSPTSNKSHIKSARPRHSGPSSAIQGGFHMLADSKHANRGRSRLDVLNSPCPSQSERTAARAAANATTGPFSGISDVGDSVIIARSLPVHQNRPPLPLSAQTPSMLLPLQEIGAEPTAMQASGNNYSTGRQHQHHQQRQRSPILGGSLSTNSIYATKQQPAIANTSQDYPSIRGHRNSIAFSMLSSSTEQTSSLHSSSNGGSASASYDGGTAATSVNSSRASSPMSTSAPNKAGPGSASGNGSVKGGGGGDQSWRHIIHTCCEVGHMSLVEELVESGLDIDKRDSAGNTPLHIAANAGHEEIMAYLLEKGCNVDAVNHAGWTAAHLATVKGHRGCLRLLLELNASPWARVNTSSL